MSPALQADSPQCCLEEPKKEDFFEINDTKIITSIDWFDDKVEVSSVQFSRSVVSDSLRPDELQHTRLPYPSPDPGVYPNSCPLSQ